MELEQAIIVRADLHMGKGKIAAQAAHASIEAMLKADKSDVEEWRASGMKKVVLKVSSKKELLELFERLKKKFPVALIKDAGRTQVEPGEATCIGIGPVEEKEIDLFVKDLKLL
ncbi:MAG: peptidyl-tRNA hydrolase Pth2 [Candidatus ainarchaeum sp.]|nr:peptidyl-tRNA hydrolase Pth2 [Candidatus ainarchaeum sp.]